MKLVMTIKKFYLAFFLGLLIVPHVHAESTYYHFENIGIHEIMPNMDSVGCYFIPSFSYKSHYELHSDSLIADGIDVYDDETCQELDAGMIINMTIMSDGKGYAILKSWKKV